MQRIELTVMSLKKNHCGVQIKETRLGLETAIRYFEQQSDGADVDFNDLRVFRKYLNLLSLKELQSRRQQKIDFYKSQLYIS